MNLPSILDVCGPGTILSDFYEAKGELEQVKRLQALELDLNHKSRVSLAAGPHNRASISCK